MKYTDNTETEKTVQQEDNLNQQKRITEFFLTTIRKQCEQETVISENENNDNASNEEETQSTQEFITDARERRKQNITDNNKTLKCDQCKMTTRSKTILDKHVNMMHNEDGDKEMRTRYTCNICNFKTTSKSVLDKHNKINHKNQEKKSSKRKSCDICDKKFNKKSTLEAHMKTLHRKNATYAENELHIQGTTSNIKNSANSATQS